MLPTLVLVGRPNVGKSTLFNRLTQSRAALVADYPGLTRDRHFGRGLGEPLPISSAHGENVRDLVNLALAACPAPAAAPDAATDERVVRIRVAIVGRPNVGKSTLVNTLLGEERVIVFDQPGTTRDSISLDFDRGGRHYTLVDTAGVRKRGKVIDAIKKFSIIKTLQAIEDANVAVLLVDAQGEISE